MPIFSKPYTANQLWSIFDGTYSSIKDRDVVIHVFTYEYGKLGVLTAIEFMKK